MVSRRLDENELKKSRTISLLEFITLESEVMSEFQRDVTKEPWGAEAVLPIMLIMPTILTSLAHKLFDEAEPAMDEAQDADRVEKKE